MVSGTLCEPLSAHKAYRLGISSQIVPAPVDGKFVANPLVITDRYLDEFGRIIHGEFQDFDELAAGKEVLKRGEIDLPARRGGREAVRQLISTFP